jgi:hypothetical protein
MYIVSVRRLHACMLAYIIYMYIQIWQDSFEIQIQTQTQTQTHATLSVCTVHIAKP